MSGLAVNLTPEYIGIVSALTLNNQKTAMEQANQYIVIRENIRRMRKDAKNPLTKLAISIFCGEDMTDEFILTHPYESSAAIVRAIHSYTLVQHSIFDPSGALNVFFGHLSIDNCYTEVSSIYATAMNTMAIMDALAKEADEVFKDKIAAEFIYNLKNSFSRDLLKLGECTALSGYSVEQIGEKCGALVKQDALQGYENYPEPNMTAEQKKAAAEESVMVAFMNLCTITRYMVLAYTSYSAKKAAETAQPEQTVYAAPQQTPAPTVPSKEEVEMINRTMGKKK